jgi:hypothetical protein
VHDEVAHVRAREPRLQEHGEEGERQRGEPGDLPPEEVVDDLRRPGREGEDPVQQGPEAGDGRSEQQGGEHPARSGRRADEPPGDEDAEEEREDAVADDRERLLEPVDEAGVPAHEEQALARRRVEEAELPGRIVEEEDCEREGRRHGVGGAEEPALEPARHAPGRVREGDVGDQDPAELAEQEEDGERERVVAVAELAGEEREARGHHQRAEPVPRPAPPGDEPCSEERPGGKDARERSCRRRERLWKLVDLHLVGEHAEHEGRGRNEGLERTCSGHRADRHTGHVRWPGGEPRSRAGGKPRDESEDCPVPPGARQAQHGRMLETTEPNALLDPDELDTLLDEIRRYLDAVETFRREGHEPRWRLETVAPVEVPS